jgi:hypothetical protein
MTSVRKRLETFERSQSVRGGTESDQIVRRALACVSDPNWTCWNARPGQYRKGAS